MTKPKLHLVPASEAQVQPKPSPFIDFISGKCRANWEGLTDMQTLIDLALEDPTATQRQLDMADQAQYWFGEAQKPRGFFGNKAPPQQVQDNLFHYVSFLYMYGLGRYYVRECPPHVSVTKLKTAYAEARGKDPDQGLIDGMEDESLRTWRPL